MNFQKETYQHLTCLVVSAFMFLYPVSDAFLITETKTWTGPVSIDTISRERSTGVFKQPSFITRVDHKVALRKGLFELSMQDDGQDVTDAKEVRTQKLLKTVRENMTSRVVDDGVTQIDNFIYTEALMANVKEFDEDQKRAWKLCRQTCLDFITDVNTLLTTRTGDYLNGSVYFEETRITVYRDEVSNVNHMSNIGTVRLLQACINEQAAITGSLGITSRTMFNTSRTTTAETFNVDTVIDTCSSLLTSFNSNTLGSITSAVKAVGLVLNSSIMRSDLKDKASTMNFFVALDYNELFDEIVASFEIISFEFDLEAFLTIKERKGTVKTKDSLEMRQRVEVARNPVNMERLVNHYNKPKPDNPPEDPDAPVVGPGGNVSTLDAPGSQLKPLPKPNSEFIPELHQKVYEETGVFPPRHVIGEPIPGQERGIGYKIRR